MGCTSHTVLMLSMVSEVVSMTYKCMSDMLLDWLNDGHESKPAMCILIIIEDSQITSLISYFTTYSFYDQT